jgi:D-hexose-6-phosphate mutarotase
LIQFSNFLEEKFWRESDFIMKISDKMTQQQFQKLLLDTYFRVEKSEKLEVKDLIVEIKQQINLIIHEVK